MIGQRALARALTCVLAPLASVAAAADRNPEDAVMARLRAAAGGELRVHRSSATGAPTFLSTRGSGIPVAGATASDRAVEFMRRYGRVFRAPQDAEFRPARAAERDSLGLDHVRLQQFHRGVPVTGAETVVHLRGGRVVAANGKTLAATAAIDTRPALAADAALGAVRAALEKRGAAGAVLSSPRLEILDVPLLGGPARRGGLAWFVEASRIDLREYYWVDARYGVVMLNFSQLPHALNRKVYTANNGSRLPGVLRRAEGKPATGDPDVDAAYDYSGDTYDYFKNEHNRDSFDGKGAALISTTHFCPSPAACPFQNAFWNGKQMVYGEGFSIADDVDAHELTHAVTERTAGLFYYMQSGALNESFSDIFGETVDLTNGAGNDVPGVRWQMGEEVPGFGAIRNMIDPTLFGDPGKMSDPQLVCELYPVYGDGGGVHSNSGIPNHAYALMVDGGSYNGFTITGVGLTKAGKVQYRALSTYLTTSSDFLDNFNAINQSCQDLIGTAGITAGDCTQVQNAMLAVEMNAPWDCSPPQASVPDFCPAGLGPVDFHSDDMEKTGGRFLSTFVRPGVNAWTTNPFARAVGGPRIYYSEFAASETRHLWGFDWDFRTDSNVAMNKSVTVPANARMQFNHAYGFEVDPAAFYDGGVLELSVDNGRTWTDAGSLVTAGAGYGGVLASGFGNPLGGRPAFVGESWGYTATQLDLSSLAGQKVRFRFRLATDNSLANYGWFLDDLRLYTCDVGGTVQFAATDYTVTEVGKNAKLTVSRTAGAAGGVAVDFTTADGTATEPEDYTATTGRLFFAPSQTTATLSVPIVNDTLDDDGESFGVSLFNLTGPTVSLGADVVAAVAITDNDKAGSLQFSAPKLNVSEAKTSVVVNVQRTGGTASGVSVDFTTADGTATDGGDYTVAAGTLNFGSGVVRQTITVPLIPDTADEPNETFTITLSNPQGGGALGIRTTITITILDNDVP